MKRLPDFTTLNALGIGLKIAAVCETGIDTRLSGYYLVTRFNKFLDFTRYNESILPA